MYICKTDTNITCILITGHAQTINDFNFETICWFSLCVLKVYKMNLLLFLFFCFFKYHFEYYTIKRRTLWSNFHRHFENWKHFLTIRKMFVSSFSVISVCCCSVIALTLSRFLQNAGKDKNLIFELVGKYVTDKQKSN